MCPSHFLSTCLQVRPLNGFLQLNDSLKDADLRKKVPFGDLDDEHSHLGVQSPQNPHFGASIGISSQICEKLK